MFVPRAQGNTKPLADLTVRPIAMNACLMHVTSTHKSTLSTRESCKVDIELVN